MTIDPAALRDAALTSKAWPYEEARKLIARWPDGKPGGAPMLFETGYGPSGLPHIGTFNEVLRTTMVRHAYETLTGAPTRLIAFSDDMDGLRKVPDNVPNQAMLAEHIGRPLTRIPDPFGTHDSFAAHNNAMLRQFLDRECCVVIVQRILVALELALQDTAIDERGCAIATCQVPALQRTVARIDIAAHRIHVFRQLRSRRTRATKHDTTS